MDLLSAHTFIQHAEMSTMDIGHNPPPDKCQDSQFIEPVDEDGAKEVYDVLGCGFGPANLAIAVALCEKSAGVRVSMSNHR